MLACNQTTGRLAYRRSSLPNCVELSQHCNYSTQLKKLICCTTQQWPCSTLQALQAKTRCSTCAQWLCELVHRLIAGWHFWRREDSDRSGFWSLDEACNEGARLPAMLLGLDCQRCSSPSQPIRLILCNSPASKTICRLSCRLETMMLCRRGDVCHVHQCICA